MRGEIICISAGWRLADLHQTLLDRSLEVGIYESQGDAEFGCDPPLRPRTIDLNRREQPKYDPVAAFFLSRQSARHLAQPFSGRLLPRSWIERQANNVHPMNILNHCNYFSFKNET